MTLNKLSRILAIEFGSQVRVTPSVSGGFYVEWDRQISEYFLFAEATDHMVFDWLTQ